MISVISTPNPCFGYFHVLFFSIYFEAFMTCGEPVIAGFVPLTDRPIASIAFHAEGELLAVASGHKVLNLIFYCS